MYYEICNAVAILLAGLAIYISIYNRKRTRREVKVVTTALENLKAQVDAIDARDDQIVIVVDELRVEVAALKAALANSQSQDAELNALAVRLSESVAKFDNLLPQPEPQPEPVPTPEPEPAPEPTPEEPA